MIVINHRQFSADSKIKKIDDPMQTQSVNVSKKVKHLNIRYSLENLHLESQTSICYILLL